MVPSRHPAKMPPQDLKMPSAIFPQTPTSHALIQHQFSAKYHQCVSANDTRLFLMVPLDILTKCHHKIWKCHQPFFHKPLHSHALNFNISFQPNDHQCVSANDTRLFLMVPLDILTKCHHKIWKCHQFFFYKMLQVMPWFNISFQPNAINVFLQMIPDFFEWCL